MGQCQSRKSDGPSLEARPSAEPSSTAKRFTFMIFWQSLKLSSQKSRPVSKLLVRAPHLSHHYSMKVFRLGQLRFAVPRFVRLLTSRSLSSELSPTRP